jgi:hypothetical protein
LATALSSPAQTELMPKKRQSIGARTNDIHRIGHPFLAMTCHIPKNPVVYYDIVVIVS